MDQPFDYQSFLADAIKNGAVSEGELDPATWQRKRRFSPTGEIAGGAAGQGPLAGAAMPQGPPAPEGLPGNDPIESELMRLLNHKQGFGERFLSGGSIPVPNNPIHKQAVPRMFLRGLVGGVNAGMEKPHGGNDSQIHLLMQALQARTQAARGHASEALAGTREARTDQILHAPPKTQPVDPLLGKKQALYDSRIGASDALRDRRNRPDQPRSTGGGLRGAAPGGGNEPEGYQRAPEELKVWYKNNEKAAYQRLRLDPKYGPDNYAQDMREIARVFAERMNFGGVSGNAGSTAPTGIAPAPQSTAPTKRAVTRDDVKARL